MATEDEDVSDIELDDNDKKIIQLYEVINELIEEQKARTTDLTKLLENNISEETILSNLEERNDSLLQQIYNELELNEKKEEDDNTDDEDDEDESDEGWEIYNSVVLNLNNYMTKIAEFTQKLKDDKEQIELIESNNNNDEIIELEQVISEQTDALQQQMKRNNELENALSNVLTEYSDRINSSNKEITQLHKQLTNQNNTHQNQLNQLRNMYENKIKQLENTAAAQYQSEIDSLLTDLEKNRLQYTKQIELLTKEIATTQETHYKEILKLTNDRQRLIKKLADKNVNNNKNNNNFDNSFNVSQYIKERIDKLKNSLKCERTKLDIDYGITNPINTDYNSYNSTKKRTFTSNKTHYGDSSNMGSQQLYFGKYKKHGSNKFGY